MQNVGTPRFYINILEWLDFTGSASTTNSFRTLPVGSFYGQGDSTGTLGVQGLFQRNAFIAILGHNFGTVGTGITINIADFTDDIKVNDCYYVNSTKPYDGFSIMSIDNITSDELGISFTDGAAPAPYYANFGSIIIGIYYDMPHSPELKLSMTREMDGAKRVRTRGGSDLVDYKYTKPPMWGELGAWELHDSFYLVDVAKQNLSRVGRRSWDLSFNHLSAKDIMGAPELINSTAATYIAGGGGWQTTVLEDLGWDSDDVPYPADSFAYSIRDHNDFFTQVIHKTAGGALPFIFQPDSNNYNPDQFAICKLDMKSFKFSQVANGVYNMKLKIREVW